MPIRLVTISGPRGAGKNTVQNALLEQVPGMRCIVPHTTRPPRPGEKDGREYHFVSEVQFSALVDRGDFVWHTRIGRTQRSGTVESEFTVPASCSVIDVLPSGGRVMRERVLGLGGAVLHLLVLAPLWIRRRRISAREPAKSRQEIVQMIREDPVTQNEMNLLDYDLLVQNSENNPEWACRAAVEAVTKFLLVEA